MTRSERIYRALLLAYPLTTRDAYGEDMAQLFVDQLRDAPNGAEKAAVWTRAIVDTFATAPRQRLASRRAVTIAEGPPVGAMRPFGPDLVAAASPFMLFGALAFIAPAPFAPLFDDRAALLGMPFGVTMTILLGLLAALGIFAIRRGGLSDAKTRLLVLCVFAVPIPVWILGGHWDYVLLDLSVASIVIVVAGVRWLSLAIALPFAAWLLLGPAIVLVLINEGS